VNTSGLQAVVEVEIIQLEHLLLVEWVEVEMVV
jgi:hypothetical protein